MSVTVDGIFSGLNTTAIIDAIIGVQAGQRNVLQQRLDDERASRNAITVLNSSLQSLSDAAEALQDTASEGYKATVAEDAGFTVEAGTGAVPGTYDVDITSLASSEMEVSGGFTDASAAILSTGTLDITIDGTTTSITVDGTNNSLTGLASAIDAVDGVQAYVLNDGSATPFRLVVQSETTGADQAITIDTSGLGGGTTPTFTEQRTAADAALTINGLAVTSSSNNITAVPGLTINANEAGLGASTVEVELDEERIQENLQTFVDAYNEVIDLYARNNTFDQESGQAGPLFGDGTVRRVIDRIGTLISNPYTTTSSLSILAQAGIETTQTGDLTLDTTELEDLIATDFEDLVDFLTSDTGPLAALKTEIDDVFIDSVNGTLENRQDSIDQTIRDLEDQIADEDERLEAQTDILRARFAALEGTLANLQSSTQFISNLALPNSST